MAGQNMVARLFELTGATNEGLKIFVERTDLVHDLYMVSVMRSDLPGVEDVSIVQKRPNYYRTQTHARFVRADECPTNPLLVEDEANRKEVDEIAVDLFFMTDSALSQELNVTIDRDGEFQLEIPVIVTKKVYFEEEYAKIGA